MLTRAALLTRWHLGLAIFPICAVVAACTSSASPPTGAVDSLHFISAQKGDLPIILTAPHGGNLVIPGVPVRRKGTTVTDAKTFELTETVAKGLENLLGRKPYIVAASFDRKYIDANRAESAAFEHPHAKPVYDAYHTYIRNFVDELRRQYPHGALLLDIHGQSQDPATVHRGTRDGLTVKRLVKNHETAALIGPNSIFGIVQARGYTVYPPNTPLGSPPEDRRFNGGYIVAAYGSHNQDGIDAIQLEIGILLRENWTFAKALVEATAIFYKHYLVKAEKELRSTPAIRKYHQLTRRFRPIASSDG